MQPGERPIPVNADRGTRITIESERILILARRRASRGWCAKCGCEVELVPHKEAVTLLQGVSLEHPAKSERWLHLEQAKQGLAVCLQSILLLVRTARRH